ncbi:MAG TPA: transcriptional regulator [bacterium]|jgi:DNA-binding transcriptional ArsR family regulator
MTSPAESGDFKPLAELDPVIHAPARLAIVAALCVVQEADFVFLQKHTGLTRGNLSSHLSKLEAAGYVTVEKKFVERVPRTLLKLTPQGLEAFHKYRQQMQQTLNELPEGRI